MNTLFPCSLWRIPHQLALTSSAEQYWQIRRTKNAWCWGFGLYTVRFQRDFFWNSLCLIQQTSRLCFSLCNTTQDTASGEKQEIYFKNSDLTWICLRNTEKGLQISLQQGSNSIFLTFLEHTTLAILGERIYSVTLQLYQNTEKKNKSCNLLENRDVTQTLSRQEESEKRKSDVQSLHIYSLYLLDT